MILLNQDSEFNVQQALRMLARRFTCQLVTGHSWCIRFNQHGSIKFSIKYEHRDSNVKIINVSGELMRIDYDKFWGVTVRVRNTHGGHGGASIDYPFYSHTILDLNNVVSCKITVSDIEFM